MKNKLEIPSTVRLKYKVRRYNRNLLIIDGYNASNQRIYEFVFTTIRYMKLMNEWLHVHFRIGTRYEIQSLIERLKLNETIDDFLQYQQLYVVDVDKSPLMIVASRAVSNRIEG